MQIAFDDGCDEWRKQWMFETIADSDVEASHKDSDLEEDYDVWEQRYDAERAAEAVSRLSERELNRYYLAAAALDIPPTASVIFALQQLSAR